MQHIATILTELANTLTDLHRRQEQLEAEVARLRLPVQPERMTAADVAEFYGIALGTARNWMRDGRIPAYGPPRGRYCKRSELEVFDQWRENRLRRGLGAGAGEWWAKVNGDNKTKAI